MEEDLRFVQVVSSAAFDQEGDEVENLYGLTDSGELYWWSKDGWVAHPMHVAPEPT